MKTIFVLVCLIFCLGLCGQERFIDVDGQKFRIREYGEGDITVVFESGMSDSLEVWGSIPYSAGRFARVFLYDRADIGKSDTSRQERTIPNMVNELRSLLKETGIPPPYILVGHSLGGFITRYYISLYPDEVKALLLLDPAPESFWEKMSRRKLRRYLRRGNVWYEYNYPNRYRKEWYQFEPNIQYMKDLKLPPDLPVILASATAWNWYRFHEDILAGSEHARHIELEGEHHIFRSQPDSILHYIEELKYIETPNP
jgi:pimeloyl-ACP methyl ester carboxylesterase